ncbi:MAG: hypothetical protein ACJAVL_001992 [Bacteroidia bacterium]|jgi:hypothetical protein
MAKLVMTKEKYGVAISCRVDVELAHSIHEMADRADISMGKMVGLLVTKGLKQSNQKHDYEKQRQQYEEQFRSVCARFVKSAANGDEQRERELVQLFRELWTDEFK